MSTPSMRVPVRVSVRARVAPALVGATRVVLGLLWLNEGVTKYRAGFGGADILLVADSAASNSRVPAFYQAFADGVLGGLPGVFGFVIPLLETGIGIALILGLLTIPATIASVGTLTLYWLADQLIAQYPIMIVLSAMVLLWPPSARRYGLTTLLMSLLARRPGHGGRTGAVLRGRHSRWL